MSPEDIMAVIEKVEIQKQALMAKQPEAKQQAKLLRALPAAAKQYRDQITKGVRGQYHRSWPCQGGGAHAVRGA
jgi:hypothetical protein